MTARWRLGLRPLNAKRRSPNSRRRRSGLRPRVCPLPMPRPASDKAHSDSRYKECGDAVQTMNALRVSLSKAEEGPSIWPDPAAANTLIVPNNTKTYGELPNSAFCAQSSSNAIPSGGYVGSTTSSRQHTATLASTPSNCGYRKDKSSNHFSFCKG